MRASLAPAVLALALLAGCAGPAPEPSAPAPQEAPAAAPAAPGNAFLLDAPRPPGATVSDGAEPSILVDRLGRAIWIGDTSGLSVSFDNGTTWTEGASPFLLSADGWGLAQDDAGALYLSTTALAWVDVARSDDLGRTATVTGRFVDAAPVADRPWIAARGDGEVAMVFYAFGRVADEACARSLDGGQTWLDRQPFAGAPNPGNLAYDEEGTLYFAGGDGEVWVLPGGCLPNLSHLGTTLPMFPGGLGANNQIQVATAGDALYAVAAGPGNREMLLSGSRGLGAPRTIAVSPPQLRSNAFGAVSAWGDEVAVAWYGSETPGDPSAVGYPGAFNVYVARVRGFWGAPEVTYHRLTAEPNHVGDICMGGIGCGEEADRDLLDYFGVDHDPWGGLHVAYGHDGAGSAATVRYARVPPGLPGTALAQAAPPLPPAPAAAPDGEAPVAAFAHRASGLTVHVDASASSDPQGGPLAYAWDWGDGASSSGVTAQHAYARTGAFTITLRVTDADGRTGTASQGVIADGGSGNRVPEPRIRVEPARPVAGADVRLLDASSDPDGSIRSRAWEVDGQPAGDAPELRLRLEAGAHVVRLRVTDDGGASASAAVRVAVAEAAAPAPAPGGEIRVEVPGPPAWAALGLAAAAAAARRPRA